MSRRQYRRIGLAGLVVSALILCSLTWADSLQDANKAIRLRQFEKGRVLYQRAAERGSTEAQFQLAQLYATGLGTKVNLQLAKKWYLRAANNNHAQAQYSLAILLEETDPSTARTLLERAAANHYGLAVEQLARLDKERHEKFNPTQEDLFSAAKKNNTNRLDRIKATNFNLHSMDDNGRTALYIAVESNSADAVKWLLRQGLKPGEKDRYGITPFNLAIDSNNVPIFKLLLSMHKGVLPVSPAGDTLLHQAVREKNMLIAQSLIKKKIALNAENKDHWTALDIAQARHDRDFVQLLLKYKARNGQYWKHQQAYNVSDLAESISRQPKGKSAALIEEIILSGKEELFKRMIEPYRGRSLNKIHDSGETFLTLAALHNQTAIVQKLLSVDADINQTNQQGMSALAVAARHGQMAVVQQLLQRGADPLVRDINGSDAVMNALASNQSESALVFIKHMIKVGKKFPAASYTLQASQDDVGDVVLFLAKSFRGLNARDASGRNAVWYAAKFARPKWIRPLIGAGIDPSNGGQAPHPVLAAADSGCLACFRLLKRYVSLDVQDDGMSAMMLAAQKANADLVSWLLFNEADPELRNNRGNTALIFAVEANSTKTVAALIRAGVNVSRKNKNGLSALDIARESNKALYEAMKKKRFLGVF